MRRMYESVWYMVQRPPHTRTSFSWFLLSFLFPPHAHMALFLFYAGGSHLLLISFLFLLYMTFFVMGAIILNIFFEH